VLDSRLPRTVVPETGSGPLGLVNLEPLMEKTSGRADIVVGLLDGPVESSVASLAGENIRTLEGAVQTDGRAGEGSRQHGTFIAGVLSGRRGSVAPAICPECTLLVRPIFLSMPGADSDRTPRATLKELSAAIRESLRAGVHVLNLSVAVTGRFPSLERELHEALDEAMRRGTIVVAAAGNQQAVGTSTITAHRWVIPVVSYELTGRPSPLSNLSASIGKRGLGAPGEQVMSLTPNGEPVAGSGTSVATPFVSGAIALLWSQVPRAPAEAVRFAVSQSGRRSRSIVPPLLDAWAAWLRLKQTL
jgi:subtilisin family serine protease